MVKSIVKNTFFFLVIFLISAFSCSRTDEDMLRFPEGSTESVNLWIQDSMKRYYLWADQMPQHPDYHLPHKEFFSSLLSSKDRFSYLVNSADNSTYPQSVRSMYGFDYAVLQLGNGEVITVIKLVLKNSPASNSGLQRGMIITKINGQTITASNAEDLTKNIAAQHMVDLSVGFWQNNTVTDEKNIKVYYGYSFEQPLSSVVYEKNGKKTAYLFVYDFRDGIAQSFNQKFMEFKNQGVQELILDLRYNYGGSVASAAALCSLIPSGITANSPFIIYKGNKNGGEVKRSFAQQIAYDVQAPDFNTLHVNSLLLNKVYVLTSENTASASEIVINNLKPYTEVIQIGEATLGKDLAGFVVEDKNKPKKVTWQLHPVIYKVFNASNQGDYSQGIFPQFQVNEFSELPIRNLGDPEETLFKEVLSKIHHKTSLKNTSADKVKIIYQSDAYFSENSQVLYR